MIVPLICFALGALILLYAILGYGRLFFQFKSNWPRQRDLLIYLVGYSLIAGSLMLGLIGYSSHMDALLLRPTRIGMGVLGLIMLIYQFIDVTGRP